MTPHHLKLLKPADARSPQSIDGFMGLAFCRVTDDDQPGRVAAEEEGGLLAPSSLPPSLSSLAREEKLGGVTTLEDGDAATTTTSQQPAAGSPFSYILSEVELYISNFSNSNRRL